MRAKTHLKAAAVVSALALLAGCGDGNGADDTPAAPADTAPAGDDTADDTADDAGETEDGAAAPAGEAGDFTLGYVLPETGQLAFLGGPMIAGAKMAISDINEDGGVLGAQVPEIIAGDEAGQDTVAQASADRILQEGVSGVIGAAASGMSLAIIDRVTGAEVMQCSGSNTAPTFTDYEDNGYYMRTAPSDALQGPVLAETIVGDGHQSVAIIARADDYGRGLADATAQALENAGATVEMNETYDPNATDFSAVVQQATSAGADATVVISFDEGAQVLAGLIEGGLSADTFYGVDGNRSNTLAGEVNPSDEGVLEGMRGTAPASDENDEFIDRLMEFDSSLTDTLYAAQVYDCVMLMALAAEAADSATAADFKDYVVDLTGEGTQCSSFGECRDLVGEGEDIQYVGASGPIDFTDAQEPASATIEVWEYDGEGQANTVTTVESTPQD